MQASQETQGTHSKLEQQTGTSVQVHVAARDQGARAISGGAGLPAALKTGRLLVRQGSQKRQIAWPQQDMQELAALHNMAVAQAAMQVSTEGPSLREQRWWCWCH